MIEVQNIFKSFGHTQAVDGVSFSVSPGEVVGFLGPNGAGKTTTLRMLTGFLTPGSGTVTIDNLNVAANPIAVQKRLGYLPENNPLYNEMLVKEFLEFSGKLKNLSNLQSHLEPVVKATGLAEVYYRPIGELSKGYRQRVGLAAALLGDPPVLILDEPTEGLDPTQRAEIRALIKNPSSDRTILMSTHVMQEAIAVCNRLLVISHGSLVADNTPEKIVGVEDVTEVTSEKLETIFIELTNA